MPKRKKKNPAPHELIMTGASILGAIGSVARIFAANPPRNKKALYRARLQQLLTDGLPGPVASDQARRELGYRNNPLTKDEQKKLERLAQKHIEAADKLESQRERYYNYGVASGYTRASNEFGERRVNYLPPRIKNPLLATIGNPGPKKATKKKVAKKKVAKRSNKKALPRRKNFDGPRIKQLGKISIDKIRDLPGFDENYKRFKKLHDTDPTEVIVYEVPDGIDAKKVVIMLGQVPEIHYVTPIEASNKNGYHWVHKTAPGKEPVHLYNPLTDEHIIVPPHKDGMRVTDWLREYNE